MRRALSVVVIAVLVAAVSGIDDTALAVVAAQESATKVERRVRKIGRQLADLPPHAVVRVRRTDGTTVVLLLEEVRPDAIVGTVAEGDDHRRETIAIEDITSIQEVKGRALRSLMTGATWVLAIVGAALLITCASAANDRQPSAREPDTEPLHRPGAPRPASPAEDAK